MKSNLHNRAFDMFKWVFPCIPLFVILSPSFSHALSIPTISFGVDNATSPEQVSTGLQVLFLLTILSIAPAILLMTTCFTRVVIVLGFVRQAMGTQNMPPTQVVTDLHSS